MADPTVRQAIEAYLIDKPDADSLVMLMLGRHLGPSRRVQELDSQASQEQLKDWFDQTWDGRGLERRAAAHDEIESALTFWWRKGWIEIPKFGRKDPTPP